MSIRLPAAALTTVITAAGFSSNAGAAVINSFETFVNPPTAGVWYETDMRGAGTASIVSLTGQGGDLENNQPLPTGAARLTTGSDNNDKAEVAVFDNYGNASTLFNDFFGLNYSYYKQAGGNAFAAPSIKLTIGSSICNSGDCFGTLVYEPTWNQAAPGSQLVPSDAWQDVAITATSGLFWWTGGFGQPNTAGGPPLQTLDDWMTAFDNDFATADLLAVSVGVGTFNQDQVGYFDDVRISSATAYNANYDFEAAGQVPEPSSLLLLAIGILAGHRGLRRISA